MSSLPRITAPTSLVTGWASGATYRLPGATTTSSSYANNTAYALPLLVPPNARIDRIGIETTANGEAGSVIRLGAYTSGTNGYPDALIVDGGTVAGDGGAAFKTVTVDVVLPAPYVWLVAAFQSSPTTRATVRAVAQPTDWVPSSLSGNPSTSSTVSLVSANTFSSTLPATFGTPASIFASGPFLYVRAA